MNPLTAPRAWTIVAATAAVLPRRPVRSCGGRTHSLVVDPETGELWMTGQGPNGGNEINVLKRGRDYGRPRPASATGTR